MGKGRLMTPGVSLFILFTCIPRRRYQERLCQATNWYQPLKLCQRVWQIRRADAAVPETIVFHSIHTIRRLKAGERVCSSYGSFSYASQLSALAASLRAHVRGESNLSDTIPGLQPV
ncbi:hypothetical protein AGABI1DRAFT_116738, partial [Agaricus bisporus var. burnettii JB137-S8]